jgi:hypothetical protein
MQININYNSFGKSGRPEIGDGGPGPGSYDSAERKVMHDISNSFKGKSNIISWGFSS